MARWPGLVCGVVLLLAGAGDAAAQGRVCDLVQEADFRRLVNARGETMVYFRDPVRFQCTGDVTLEADSAILNQTARAVELIGAVVYRDSTHQLTAEWANYLGSLEQLLGRGDVVLTDLVNGSVVTGEQLQHLRESATRAVAHTIVTGGRPRAVLRDAPRAEAAGDPSQPPDVAADTVAPVEVTADRLEFLGDSLFLARGNTDIARGTTTGAADSARYDRRGEVLTLLGRAHVEDPRYRLEGERIDAHVRGEALREVLAERSTRLVSEELTVTAERLRIGFVDGALDRLEAWNPPPPQTDDEAPPTGPRATALAEDFQLQADSIDAVADSGRIREVRAVGRAYGERLPDSLSVPVPAVAARDWVQGDTIIGHFAEALRPIPDRELVDEGATADTTETVLERVVVIGGAAPALSLYRMEPGADGEGASINFMKASRIILYLTEGEVARVEAEGPIDGVYLDPVRRRPAPEATTPPAARGSR